MSTIAEHLDTASEAVRAANHATHDGPTTATDAYTTVGTLEELARRLVQLVAHLARSTGRAKPGDYFDDRDQDPAPVLRDSAGGLQAVRGGLDALAAVLGNVHNHLGHLGRLDPEED